MKSRLKLSSLGLCTLSTSNLGKVTFPGFRNIFAILIALFFIVGASLPGLAQTNYYVDPKWGGAQSGTASQPWTSLGSSAWSTINTALGSGPVNVYFSARLAGSDTDTTWTGTILLDRTDSSTNRLYLSGNEFYNQSETTPSWVAYSRNSKFHADGGNSASLASDNFNTTTNRNYITIHGFKLSNTGSSQGNVILEGMDYLIFEYNEAYVNAGTSIGPDIVVGRSSNSSVCGGGPLNWNKHSIYRYNYIHDSFGEGLYINGSIADAGTCHLQTGDDILITHNTFLNCGQYGGDGDCLDVKDGNTNLRVTNNSFGYNASYRAGTGQEDCQSITAESMALLDSNFFWNTTVSPSTCRNQVTISGTWDNPNGRDSLTIRNNILVAASTVVVNAGCCAALRFFGGLTSLWQQVNVYNNTIYGWTNSGIAIESGAVVNLDVRNNIVSNVKGAEMSASATGTFTHNYNDWWHGGGGINVNRVNLSGLASYEPHSLSANPQFVSTATPFADTNFKLQSSSPVINAGTVLSGFTVDYFGVTRGKGWDIGVAAYPSATSGSDTTPPSVDKSGR